MMEKLDLKWDDFQNNLVGTFHDLRSDTDFTDVTLACKDLQIETHRIALSASSTFFQRILKKSKHPHPLIYIGGMTSQDLVSIVDFIYQGETKVYKTELNRFLSLAKAIEIKGLTEFSHDEKNSKENDIEIKRKYNKSESGRSNLRKYPDIVAAESFKHNTMIATEHNDVLTASDENSIPCNDVDIKNKILDQDILKTIESMIFKQSETLYGGWMWKCKMCHIEKRNKSHMKDHAETHLEGLSLPCNLCGKKYNTSASLRGHNIKYHRVA